MGMTSEELRIRQRERVRRYRQKYPERRKKENKETKRIRNARYRGLNKEKRAAYNREWKHNNLERVQAHRRRNWKSQVLRLPDRAATIYWEIRRALPRSLPPDMRDDVANSVYLDLLERREVSAAEIALSVRKLVAAHRREQDGFRTRSVEELIPGTDGLRILDTLTTEDVLGNWVE